MKSDWGRLGVRIVLVGFRFVSIDPFSDDPNSCVFFDVVFLAVKIPRKPAVHQFDGRRSAVATLMVLCLDWDALGLECLIDSVAVFGHYIPIVKRM